MMRHGIVGIMVSGLFASPVCACPFCDQQYANTPQGQASRQAAMDSARSAFIARFRDADVQAPSNPQQAAPDLGALARSATYYPVAAEQIAARARNPGSRLPPDL